MFKSALIYQFTDGHAAPSQEQLEAALSQHQCGEPFGGEWERSGFSRVLEHFTFGISGVTLFRVKTRTRILPDSVISAEVEHRAALELNESEGIDRAGRRRIKEEATEVLLGRAFIGTSYLLGYVDHDRGLIVINTGSASVAEDVLALMRKALETLPVRPFETDLDPSYPLTSWLSTGQLPEGLGFGESTTLKQSGHPGEASLKDTDLQSDEVHAHLHAGKKVRKVQLVYKGVVFSLSDSLAVTGIKPIGADYYGDDYAYENEAEKYAADLTLFSAWIRSLVGMLSEAMGDR